MACAIRGSLALRSEPHHHHLQLQEGRQIGEDKKVEDDGNGPMMISASLSGPVAVGIAVLL